jgi:hypothetical protein
MSNALAPVLNAGVSRDENDLDKVLVVGGVGIGKTLNFWTLPGRKFAYLFDPNARAAVQGDKNIDFLEFIPDLDEIDISIKSLTKEKGDAPIRKKISPETYPKFAKDFNDRIDAGFFKDYDWLMFDSCTTLSDIMMDRIMYINGRAGRQPQQDDYGPEMQSMKKLFRLATGVAGCNLYVTAHHEVYKDEATSRSYSRIMMTGRGRIRIPLMFSQIYVLDTEVEKNDKGVKVAQFFAQTAPDKDHPIARTTVRGLSLRENVTIDFKKPLLGQGLGRFVGAK